MNLKIVATAQCNPAQINALTQQLTTENIQIQTVVSLQQARATATAGVNVVVFYSTPMQSIVAAMAAGISPDKALEIWQEEIGKVLDFYRHHRRATTLIEHHSAAANSTRFAELMQERLSLPICAKSINPVDLQDMDIWHTLIARHMVSQSPKTTALLIQLDAATLPTSPELFTPPPFPACEYYAALAESKADKSKLETECESLSNELEQAKKAADKKTQGLAQELRELKNTLQQVQQESAQAKQAQIIQQQSTDEQINQLNVQLQTTTNQLTDTKQMLSQAIQANGELEAENQQIIEYLHKTQEDLEQQLNQQKQANNQISALTQERDNLQSALQQAQQECARAKQAHKTQQQTADAQVKQLNAQLQTTTSQLTDTQQKLSKAIQASGELEAENQQIIEHLHKTQEDLEQQLIQQLQASNQISGLAQERDNLQSAQQQAQQECAQTKQAQKIQQQITDTQIKQLNTQLQTTTSQLTDTQHKLSQAIQARCELEAENQQIIEHLHKTQEDLEQYIMNNRTFMEEKNALKQTLNATELELKATQQRLEQKLRQLNELRSSISWKAMAPARILGKPFKRTPPDEKNIKKQIALVAASQHFNAEWYANNNPDVAHSGMKPAEHYVRFGGFENRDPSPEFSTGSYLRLNPDVAEAGINPLVHYIKFGNDEARRVK